MIGMNMEVGAGKVRYTVEHRDECVLIFGGLPITAFVAMTQTLPKSAVMSPDLARIAGCTTAMGCPDDIEALIAEMTPEAILRERSNYPESALSDSAVRWLAIGERGSSSNAMFTVLSGVRPLDVDSGEVGHPHDPDDLRRCRLLLDQVPELSSHLEKLAGISPTWARISASWDTLCETMDSECPSWREASGKSPGTYKLLQSLTRPEAAADASPIKPRRPC